MKNDFMRKFSKRDSTYPQWIARQTTKTEYTQRITRLHNLYPSATLDQLRGHSELKDSGLAKQQAKPVYLRSWRSLSLRERELREKALDVLSEARKTGRSLDRLSKERGLTGGLVRKATGAFRKVNGRWKAKKIDHISRIMSINEDGVEKYIEITNSRYATIIGKYYAAIKEYLNTGNSDSLAEFRGKRVKDAQGNIHILETNLDAIRAIEERRESEFPPVYEGSQ